jgi:hypothetical protein
MLPVLGREVVESQQCIAILAEALVTRTLNQRPPAPRVGPRLRAHPSWSRPSAMNCVGKTLVGEYVDFVGNDCDQGIQESRCHMSVSPLTELGESKVRGAINRDKQVKFAFLAAHFSDVDVEVADRVPLEHVLAPCLSFDRRKPADLVALEPSMQRRSRQMRNGRLGIKAIVERQQRELPPRR